MELIKATSAALAAKRAEIANINAQIQRAHAAIAAGIPGQDKIAALQSQRQAEIGQAFIDGREPDLSGIDKALAKLEKEAADARATIAGARSALIMLGQQVVQAEADIPSLLQAQDEAINAYAVKKEQESVQMLNAALAAISVAFNHMVAAEGISRKPHYIGQPWNWQHRLHLLKSGSLNIPIDCTEQRAALKAELAAAGVADADIDEVRLVPVVRDVPEPATPEPVVQIITANQVINMSSQR
jgi:hypothetical protein